MKNYLLLFVTVCLTTFTQAASILVTSAADSGAGSLREAVTTATAGDSILFDAAINGTPIVLASEITINSKLYLVGNDTTNTIISGGDVTRIMVLNDTLHVSGIRFRNGYYPVNNVVAGGAIGMSTTGVLYADGCDFMYNVASFGGAISCYLDADAFIDDCRFYRNTGLGNTSNGGSAISIPFGDGAEVVLNNTLFEENFFELDDGNGRAGSLYCFGGKYVINNCEFLNNEVTSSLPSTFARGSAIQARGFGAYNFSVSIADCDFSGNSTFSSASGARGGAISAAGGGNLSLLRTNFEGNSVSANGGVASGGAVYFDSDTLTLIDCNFDGNSCVSNSGSFTAQGGALYIQEAVPYMERCTFINNAAASSGQISRGGGFAVTAAIDTMIVRNSTFSSNVSIGNTASYGGAISDEAINTYYTNNTIVNNSCIGGTQSTGGGVGFYRSYNYRELRNNIIADNTTDNNFADIYWETTSTYLLDNNLIRDAFPSPLVFAYTTDPGLDPGGAQLNGGLTPTIAVVNPLSEVIDNASAFAPTFDQRGAIRNGNPDIGAYEFNGCVETSATIMESACVTYTSPSGGEVYTMSGTYMDTISNALGCDSVLTIDLTILQPTAETIQVTACDSYTVPSGNDTYTTSGMYMDTITNSAGCDSVLTIDLTVNYANSGTDVITACDTYTWIDGNTYTASNNTATHTLTNALGCDSIVSLDLTINNSNTGIDVVTVCDTYTWIDGNTYTSSNNTATFTLTNAVGCDSLVTLDLTINSSTTGIDVIAECESYTWIDGNTYMASNNSATFTLVNSVGCDSIVTLDLTILDATTSTDVISECESYTWIDGNTYTSSNSTATFIETNSVGCDSIITLDLTILSPTTGTDNVSACETYTWIDGNTYTASNNTATYTLTNAEGCDSLVTLDLTILNATTGTDVITACDSYTWIDGNTYTASNNMATFTISNTAGCDSIVTLDLTINSTVAGITQLDELTLEATNAGADYGWIDCTTGMVISGETAQTFVASMNGEYAVVVTENGCSDTSDCIVIDQVNLDEVQKDLLQVYPNPNRGDFKVAFGQSVSGDVIVRAADGRIVYVTKVDKENEVSIAMPLVTTGVYLLELRTEKRVFIERISIQK
ncbi:MAG: hypothetical protein Crog4KO_16050 [Crocinitomicaceae bacterium]